MIQMLRKENIWIKIVLQETPEKNPFWPETIRNKAGGLSQALDTIQNGVKAQFNVLSSSSSIYNSLNLIFTLYCQHFSLYTNKPSPPRIIPDDDKMPASSAPVNQNFIQTIPVRKGLSRSCLAAWGTGWLVEQYPSGRCWCLPRSSLYCPLCSETLSSPPAEWLVSGADCSLLSTA